MNTTIARSSKDVKKCVRCKQDIYTFETRKNLKHGKAKHLQCPCSDKGNIPTVILSLWIIVVIMTSLFLSK